MEKLNTRRAFLLATLLLSFSAIVFGQGTASRVTGTVVDPSKAAIPGASVTLTNEATQLSLNTETSDSGTYVFDSVQVAVYTITVEKQGFKKFVSTGNKVDINQPATVNVTLEIGTVSEVVQVEASAEIVQTGSSGNFGNSVEQRTLETLPIVGTRGRNPLNFINFQPGVAANANTGGGIHVHGARDRAFNFTLDGIDINETSAGGSNFTPLRTNPDSLTEFQVVTSNFTAELGRSSGAQVTLVTRSGTNDFHGSLFEFYQTPRFQANAFINNLQGQGKPQFVQHIYGGSIGGPVFLPRFGEGGKNVYNGRNRTFFFANLQRLRATETRSVTRTVYTTTTRQGIWRYIQGRQNIPAGAANAVVDAAGNVIPGLTVTSYSVPGNDPLGFGLDPTILGIINRTPLPNNFTVGDGLNTAGFTTTVAANQEKQYDFVTKIDHNFNEKNSIYVRYAQGAQNTLSDTANDGTPRFPGFPNWVDTFRSPKNLAINYRWSPTPTITNELVAGLNRFTFSFNNPDPNANTNPPFTFTNITDSINFTPPINNLRRLTTYQLADNLSLIRGSHTFKGGINFRYQKHNDIRSSVAALNTNLAVDFSRTTNPPDATAHRITSAQLPGLNATDRNRLLSMINELLGRVGNMSQAFVAQNDTAFAPPGTLFLYDARYPEYDFYFQDTWKFRPNLTFDMGLRWEVKISPKGGGNDIILRPDRPIRLGEPPSDSIKFSEGKVFDPSTRSPKTYQWGISAQREIGFKSVVELNYIGRKGVGLYGAYDVNQVDIFNNGFLGAFNTVRAGGESALINSLLSADAGRIAAGVTGSVFLRNTLAAAALTQGSAATAANAIATRRNSGATVPVIVQSGFSPFFFRSYPQFSGALRVLDSTDFSTYHALEAQIKRRFGTGLGFQASYTLAKSMDSRSFDPTFSVVSTGNAQSASSTPFDNRNRRLNFARSDFDRRHTFQGYVVADLPFGNGRRFLGHVNPALNQIIGGWEIGAVTVFASGRPFTVYSGLNTVSNVNQSPENCNNCSATMGNLVVENGRTVWFTAAQRAQFSQPGPGELGNTGRNFFNTPRCLISI